MTRLPVVSGQQVVTALKRAGYYVRRQRGSHVRLYHAAKPPVTVALAREVKRGTLLAILRGAEMDADEFIGFLKP